MIAASYSQFGPARNVLKVRERLKPRPAPGEVLVRIHATGLNPSDVKNRGGEFPNNRGFLEGSPGYVIPHCDGAGVIAAVGGGVDESRIGERVWVHNAQWQRPFGTAAEYVALPSDTATPLPDRISFEEGACFGVPLLTAYHAVALGGALEGRTVLVSGGAGAVGSYAVQIAKAGGASVFATVSTQSKAMIARLAGCDEVIHYRSQDLPAEIARLTNRRGVDHVVEVNLSDNGTVVGEILSSGGSAAIYGQMRRARASR